MNNLKKQSWVQYDDGYLSAGLAIHFSFVDLPNVGDGSVT